MHQHTAPTDIALAVQLAEESLGGKQLSPEDYGQLVSLIHHGLIHGVDNAQELTCRHPGIILRETVIERLGLSVSDAADRLAMSRPALSRVLNGHAGISPELAIRLETAGASPARFWINLQADYDLWLAQQHQQPPVRPLQG